MIVMKFGGSSVESSGAINRVVSIVRAHLAQQPIVVVSAMGKTTDQLVEAAGHAARGDIHAALRQIHDIEQCHLNAARQLTAGRSFEKLSESLANQCREVCSLLKELSKLGPKHPPALMDEILSYGERLCSHMVTMAFDAVDIEASQIDARRLIVTNNHHTRAMPLYAESYRRISGALPRARRVAVMGGFIGATKQGVTTTLGRGGSDLTASLVGAAIHAQEIQFWKDVDGVYTCDPRILQGAYRVRSISYAEARAIACCGAKILHPSTVAPAVKHRIPLVVRNSKRPEVEGTRIVLKPKQCRNPVKSIAFETNIALSEIQSKYGFPLKALPFLLRKSTDCAHHLPNQIPQSLGPKLHNTAAIISLVGDRITSTPGLIERALAVLKGIYVVTSPVCSFQSALSFIVGQNDLLVSLTLLHREFFKHVDSDMFVVAV